MIMKKIMALREVLFFPLKVLNKDKVLWLWIIATLLSGFFTIFSDFLLGKNVNETFSQGIIYIFSIALLIPVFLILLFIFAQKIRKQKQKQILSIIAKKS